tara:strand:+ start:1563 stop:3005 length:1443 start_codon:yes stop_codon:yes gene_type:complete
MIRVYRMYLASFVLAGAIICGMNMPARAQPTIQLEDWQSYAPMAEQGAICGAFASIMEMQAITDPRLGRLWAERRTYSGSVIRRAAELEGKAINDDAAIDDLLNRYSMWLLNQFSSPDDTTLMDNDGRIAATEMISDVCVALFESADEAILAKYPELVGTTQSNEALARDLDAANHENDELIGENDELHQLLEEAETELQDALDELVLAEAAATNAETAIAEREAIAIKVAKLEKQLLAANAVVENISALKTEVATLQRNNSRLRADRDRLDAELDAAVLALLTPDDADDLADDAAAANADTADADTSEDIVDTAPDTLADIDAGSDTAIDQQAMSLSLPGIDLTSVELMPDSPQSAVQPSADVSNAAPDTVTPDTATSETATSGSALAGAEAAQPDTRLFMAQLGAFRQRLHAEAQIRLLLDTFTKDLAAAELTIAQSKLPSGSDVFRVLTNRMSAPAAARICDALWQRMVGCMLKAVP